MKDRRVTVFNPKRFERKRPAEIIRQMIRDSESIWWYESLEGIL